MAEQLSLFPMHEASRKRPGNRRRCERAFFAVLLERGAAAKAAGIAQRHNAERWMAGELLRSDRLHVTLNMLAEIPEMPFATTFPDIWVNIGRKTGDAVAVAPFTATLNRAASFDGRPGHQPYVLLGDEGVAGFRALQHEIAQALRMQGLPAASPEGYTPHVTLLYGNGRRAVSIESVTWTVRDFALVHSLVGRSVYRVLQRWTLGAAGARRTVGGRDRP